MSAGSSLWRVVELMAGVEFMAGGPASMSSRSTNSFTTASCPFIAALASGVQPYLSLESASTVVRKSRVESQISLTLYALYDPGRRT
jgi:hypothetical protein